jgi:hypothetical protein
VDDLPAHAIVLAEMAKSPFAHGLINWEKFEEFLKIWKLPEPKIMKQV